MLRKNYFSLVLLFLSFAVVGTTGVSAQITVGGTVVLKDSKDKKTPLEGAKVECFRIDVKETCGSVMTDAAGKFSITDVPDKSTIVLAMSAATVAPQVTVNVRMDNSNSIEAVAGESYVPTEEAVREVYLTYAKENGKLTADQKKELADREKSAADREKKNESTKENNSLRDKYIKEGNAAFDKGDYDTAIVNFENGYKIDPEFLGSAPVFLNNQALSIKQRASNEYNTAVKSGDKNIISAAKTKITKDFGEALDLATKSYKMVNNAKNSEDVRKDDMKVSENIIKDVFKNMGKINVNLAGNIASEEDAAQAISVYRSALEILPNDPDVLSGLGLSLYISSEFVGSNPQKQESLNYMTLYKKTAPKDHPQQPVADEIIDTLTTVNKLKPQKIDK